jgi:hypothetical protein
MVTVNQLSWDLAKEQNTNQHQTNHPKSIKICPNPASAKSQSQFGSLPSLGWFMQSQILLIHPRMPPDFQVFTQLDTKSLQQGGQRCSF